MDREAEEREARELAARTHIPTNSFRWIKRKTPGLEYLGYENDAVLEQLCETPGGRQFWKVVPTVLAP